jgi:hypothetical protein
MLQRWIASALSDASQRFRALRGYRDMPTSSKPCKPILNPVMPLRERSRKVDPRANALPVQQGTGQRPPSLLPSWH